MKRRQDKPLAKSERRQSGERRRADRRQEAATGDDLLRTPTREQQRTQFLARFLFGGLTFGYFNVGFNADASLFSLTAINVTLCVFLALHAVGLWHSTVQVRSVARWRLAMWLDLFVTGALVLADPRVPSPGYLAYIMVILGNGMRYGPRLFLEAVVGAFASGLVVIGLRYDDYVLGLNAGTVLFMLFCAIIVFYSYGLNVQAERTRRQLEREREADELTGLLNRRAFLERAEPLYRARNAGSDEPMVILFADLDGFKKINDTYGHRTGDEALATIGRAIADNVRRGDLAARYGGDEFVLLLPDTDNDRASTVAWRLQEVVADWSRRHRVKLSLSVGMGQFPQPDCDFQTALARVDKAMYEGRQVHGRGGIRRASTARH